MAKGEGGEQYSNASLLNKPPSSNSVKLASNVSSLIGSNIALLICHTRCGIVVFSTDKCPPGLNEWEPVNWQVELRFKLGLGFSLGEFYTKTERHGSKIYVKRPKQLV